ncbi:hypothetical protein C8R45DRAFT_933828 [Mycena sanguinolenta]|nr:hypothetical protein C8R45DRAFT_933828 [Mycena sanguinolenta]
MCGSENSTHGRGIWLNPRPICNRSINASTCAVSFLPTAITASHPLHQRNEWRTIPMLSHCRESNGRRGVGMSVDLVELADSMSLIPPGLLPAVIIVRAQSSNSRRISAAPPPHGIKLVISAASYRAQAVSPISFGAIGSGEIPARNEPGHHGILLSGVSMVPILRQWTLALLRSSLYEPFVHIDPGETTDSKADISGSTAQSLVSKSGVVHAHYATEVASLQKATLSGLHMNDPAWQRSSTQPHLVVGARTCALTAEPSVVPEVFNTPPVPHGVSGLLGLRGQVPIAVYKGKRVSREEPRAYKRYAGDDSKKH